MNKVKWYNHVVVQCIILWEIILILSFFVFPIEDKYLMPGVLAERLFVATLALMAFRYGTKLYRKRQSS